MSAEAMKYVNLEARLRERAEAIDPRGLMRESHFIMEEAATAIHVLVDRCWPRQCNECGQALEHIWTPTCDALIAARAALRQYQRAYGLIEECEGCDDACVTHRVSSPANTQDTQSGEPSPKNLQLSTDNS